MGEFPSSVDPIQGKDGEDTDKEIGTCSKASETTLVIVMLVVLAATVGITVWQTNLLFNTTNDKGQGHKVSWPQNIQNLVIDDTLKFILTKNNENKLLGRFSAEVQDGKVNGNVTHCKTSGSQDLCLEWPSEKRLRISYTNDGIDCYDIEWSALRCVKQVLTNCFNVTSGHWYGGYADHNQLWPFERNVRSSMAYVANDSYVDRIGGVVERYLFSSTGVGLYVDENVPLYFSLNSPDNGIMCLTAKFDKYPYFNTGVQLPVLRYKLCSAQNALDVHKQMSAKFIAKPNNIPSEALFKYPIWSTWAQYHKDINQTTVIEYAEAILAHNFTHAQIEIDDDWTTEYGDMDFDKYKFPDAKGMVEHLSDLGFKVTVWVHPFFNFDSLAFKEAEQHGFLVRQFESLAPAITPWWDGNLTSILDVSNPKAVQWYLSKLDYLKTTYNITSFKFDAGETSWFPNIYSAANMPLNPAMNYPAKWTELAVQADPSYRQEVRSGYKTQQYPIFVRMMDKFSYWGHNNSLKSIIPGVLTYGLLGYPFVLPDMIGGNAYDDQPDPELYVRWLQLNAFLPSWQYSIVPWKVNDTGVAFSVVDIAHKFTEFHETIGEILIKFAKEAVTNGSPIIRPLWWLAPEDEVALVCEDQFLLGDEFIVAPVLEQGARSRDIYIPSGSWDDQLRQSATIEGPKLLRNYRVEIDELAYFKKYLVSS